ncbi:unnamed protein product [Phaeothamnion confervicola]
MTLPVRRHYPAMMRGRCAFVLGVTLAFPFASARGPIVPYCRKQHHIDVMLVPTVDATDDTPKRELRVLAFGGKGKLGKGPATMLNDLWTLHVTNTGFEWREMHPTGDLPAPRWKFGASVVNYNNNSAPGYMIYGGDCELGVQSNFLDDLWLYSPGSSPRGGSWQQLHKKGHDPEKRRGHAQVFTQSGTLIVQGGKLLDSDTDSSPDLFTLDLRSASAKWAMRSPLPAESRWGHTLTYVRSPGLLARTGLVEAAIVYGGRRYDKGDDEFHYYSELWAYSPADDSWLPIPVGGDFGNGTLSVASAASATSATDSVGGDEGSETNTGGGGGGGGGDSADFVEPTPRDHHAAAYVAELDALFVSAGRYTELMVPPLDDMWSFSFKDFKWRRHAPAHGSAPPGPRFGHDMVVWRGGAGDGAPALIVFGGETISSWSRDYLLNDVWLYDPAGDSWRQISRSDCSVGATGQLALQLVDLWAFAVLGGIVAVIGVSLCVYHACRKRPVQYVAIA